MKCLVCGGISRVLRTEGGTRRRECLRCHHRWTTIEIVRAEYERRAKVSELVQMAASLIP